jgi:hypothetical protein
MTATFVAVTVLVNVVVGAILSNTDTAVDFSQTRMFSIEDSTAKFLAGLDDEVIITVMSRESDFAGFGNFYNQANEILRRFAGAGGKLTLQYLDWLSNPDFAAEHDNTLERTDVIVRSANTGRHRIVQHHVYLGRTFYDLRTGSQISEAEYVMMSQMGMGAYVDADVSMSAENAFLTAVLSVTDTTPVLVGFTRGHGESMNQYMQLLLAANAYNVHDIDVIVRGIDDSLDTLIIHAPTVDFSDDIISKLHLWLNNDGNFGRTLLYFAHSSAQTPNLDQYFHVNWGITVNRAYVEQRDSRFTAPISIADFNMDIQYFTPLMFSENINPAFRIFGDMMRHVAQDGLEFVDGVRVGVEATARTNPILSSHPGAVIRPFEYTRDEFDYDSAASGAFLVGVHSRVERYLPGTFDPIGTDVVVFGGTNVFADQFMVRANANNGPFFLDMMNGLSGKDEDIPTIAPRSFSAATFDITQSQAETIGVIFALVLPGILIIAGVVVWFRRIRA